MRVGEENGQFVARHLSLVPFSCGLVRFLLSGVDLLAGFRYADVRQCAEWLTSYFAVMSKYGSDTQVRSYDEVGVVPYSTRDSFCFVSVTSLLGVSLFLEVVKTLT